MKVKAENRGWIEVRPDHRGRFDEIDNLLWIRFDKGEDAQVVLVSVVKGRSRLHISTEDDLGFENTAPDSER